MAESTAPAAVDVAPAIQFPVPAGGEEWVVGAVIPDAAGRIFVHRRTPDRQLLPGAWDIPGGHVEPGESILDALRREIEEETRWQLARVVADIGHTSWSDAGHQLLEVDYIVAVTGDMARPRLEAGKHDAWAWIGENELDVLRVSRQKGDLLLHGILVQAFAWLRQNFRPGETPPAAQ